jgi:hypothetical protein
MSSASQSNIDRFNKYKSLCENAGSMCVRTFLHLVRPTERFPYHSNHEIHRAWLEWKDAEEVFYHMTGSGSGWQAPPNRVFPEPPPEDAEHLPCRQMWGCLVQEQVERQDFQAPSIKEAVAAILASEACKSHPASCPCKVPNNPWTWHECVVELEPLGLKHNPKCQCGGWQTCKQKVAAGELERERLANIMGSALQKAQAELAEKPWLRVGDCRCDAQYSCVSCSCLPGRVAEANAESARMAAAAKAASERATAEADAWRAKEALKNKATAQPVGFPPLPSSPLPTPVPRQSTYDYQHHVETCPCGTCFKSRVDSGTADAYTARCQHNANLTLKRLGCTDCKNAEKVTGRNICMECYVEKNSYDSRGFLKMPTELHMLRQAYVLDEASWIATKNARDARAVSSGGGADVNSSDFAKSIFAAMGTPHDSECPHGLPFYACMPCSH